MMSFIGQFHVLQVGPEKILCPTYFFCTKHFKTFPSESSLHSPFKLDQQFPEFYLDHSLQYYISLKHKSIGPQSNKLYGIWCHFVIEVHVGPLRKLLDKSSSKSSSCVCLCMVPFCFYSFFLWSSVPLIVTTLIYYWVKVNKWICLQNSIIWHGWWKLNIHWYVAP